MRFQLLLILLLVCSGCAPLHYNRTHPGELHGKLVVQWVSPDQFIFLPDPDRPLTFTRYNQDKISPERMYTDGGSIPRPLWAFRNYSPWGYAPAFIIHDWLFDMQHCQIPGYQKYTLDDAAWVLSEVMKTMMETSQAPSDHLALYAMYEAVRSPIAAKLWNTGECREPAAAAPAPPPAGVKPEPPQPIMQYTIDFP